MGVYWFRRIAKTYFGGQSDGFGRGEGVLVTTTTPTGPTLAAAPIVR
jgi:hypothetical protein